MKRTIFIVGSVLAAVVVMLLLSLRSSDVGVAAQGVSTPGVYWDEHLDLMTIAHELIILYIDTEVRCDGDVPNAVVISQTLSLDGPALELGAGLFREFDWDWGGWEPPSGMTCVEWQRLRWEVPEAAFATVDGERFVGRVFGEYRPEGGEETWEDIRHFWYLGPLADGEWYDTCPGVPDCETPGPTPTEQPTLTPRPTYTPEPTPTCLPTPTCPPVWPTHTPYPTATAYFTATPWPTQPPF